MTKTIEKRRTIFIKKAFQGRFILNVLLIIMLSGLCSAGLIYWITGGDLLAESQTAHENIRSALDHLGISILIANMAALIIASIFAVLMVLYASHKIAGPLYRFEKYCQQIGDGQLDTFTPLRQNDQLQELGTAFYGMVIKLRERKEQRLMLITQLTDKINQLQQDPAIAAAHTEQLAGLRQLLGQLRD